MKQDDIEFHSERARAERELAQRAASADAARAHQRLSTLHLERLRCLSEPAQQLFSERVQRSL
jgi:hypothetical protein